MAKEHRIKINSLDIHKGVRDEAVKAMITATGGVNRVHADKKRKAKADASGRKRKYKEQY